MLKKNKIKEKLYNKNALEIEEAFETSRLHKELIQRTPNAFVKYKVIREPGKLVDVKYLEVNKAFEKLFGRLAKDVLGRTRRDINPTLEEDWYLVCERAVLTGKAETKQRYEAGINKFLKISIVPMADECVAALITDITQEMNALEILAVGWVRAMGIRDKETQGHCDRVAEMAVHLAKKMGIEGSNLEYIQRGALLHDIGKIGIRDSLLFKKGKFNEKEATEMKKHPLYAEELLKSFPIREILDIPVYHHEKWDGSGYPKGLKGEEIPLAARIFSVVDVWDALVSQRRYHKAWSREKVLNYIGALSGKDFDPEITKNFLEMMA